MTRYAKTMSQALAEMKMNDPKLNKIFDKLKPRDTIQLKVSSSIAKGKDFQPYTVKSKNTLRNGTEKITMILQGNPTGVKRFLYKKDGKVTFAIGDMAASIDDIKEEIKEGTWKYAETPKEIAALKKLMSRPLPIGNDEDEKTYKDSASSKLYGLLGDDELFDALGVLQAKGNPKADARKTIIKWFKQRVKDDSYGLGDETKALGKAIGLKMEYVPEGLDENYRKLAMMGIGTETKKAAKVGLKTDYYLPKNGDKSFGKITRVTSSGYEITDEKTKKVHKFKFYDPNNDPTSVRGTREEVELDEAKYKYDGKVVKISKKEFAKVSKDYKNTTKGKERMMILDPKTQASISVPVQFEELELDEKYELYHKTFSDAMQHAYDYAKKKLGITVDPKEIDNKVATGPRKPSEGKTNKYRLKGKGGNLQIQVYNKGGSKPFELNMYKEENEMYDKLTDGNLSLKETVLQMWQEAAKGKDEGNAFGAALAAAKEKGEDTFVVAGKKYDVKTEKLVGGQKKLDKDKDGDIDGKDFAMLRKQKKNNEEHQRYLETKRGSLRDSILQMWGEKKDLTKEMKNGKDKKTDTGKEMTPVDMSPKMPKVKESKNKV